MIYLLTYMPAHDRPRMHNEKASPEPTTLRWIADSTWKPAAVIADFERRFRGAKVLSLEPAEVTA
jgi:hypothetical protein